MKKLMRSEQDRKLCGVCGGIAEYFDIDSTVVRLIFIIVALASVGTGALFYFLAAILMPREDQVY